MRRSIVATGRFFVALACATSLVGCSHGVKLIEVSGHVMVDQQPLERGVLRFQPADGLGPGAEAVVKGGEYKIATTAGHKKVSIQAFKKVGQVAIGGAGGPLVDKLDQILPPKYSDPNNTELTCDVEGSKSLDFNVSAGPATPTAK